MFKSMLNSNEVRLGKKKVTVAKLTPAKWKELFSTIDKLPGLIIQVMTAPKEDFYAYVIEAFNLAIEEVTEIVSVLTGIDKEYISNHVGLDEIFEYLQRVVKLNRLDTLVKNAKSLLPKQNQ